MIAVAGGERRRGASKLGLLRTALVVALSLWFAYVATASAVLALADRGSPALAITMAPRSGPAVVPLAAARLDEPGVASNPEVVAALGNALAADPLNAEAMFAIGLAADRAGYPQQASFLIERALRYDPRSRSARTWLLERDLRAGDLRSAVRHIDRLMLLRNRQQPQFLAALALLTREPASWPFLREILAAKPGWRPNFFWELEGQGAEPATIRALLGPFDQAGEVETAVYLNRLAATGRAGEARRIWASLLRPGQPVPGPVHDPGFRGLPGLAPFAWRLTSGAQGGAETAADGGLRIAYLPSAPARLAEQMLALAPGRYQLVVDGGLSSGAASEAAPFNWRVTCNDGRALVAVPLAAAQAARGGGMFSVPGEDGCGSQSLVLDAQPTSAGGEIGAEVRRVDIVKVG